RAGHTCRTKVGLNRARRRRRGPQPVDRRAFFGTPRLQLPASARLRSASADRRSVLNAAVVPELVQAARNPELRMGADIAVEHFAVVADRPNDAHPPVAGEAERLAEVALRPDQPLD